MPDKFRIGITSDFLNAEGKVAVGDIGLGLLDADPVIEYEFFTPNKPEITPDQLARYDGVIALGGIFSRRTVQGLERLTAIGRFGVGYDRLDTDALTEADVMLFITPDGVRRPVASSILTLVLSLAHMLVIKNQWSRTGREALCRQVLGVGLAGRTLGSVGIGNIGKELFRLIAPFGMKHLAYDPYVRPEDVAGLNVVLVDLDTLLRSSDFVCMNCPLSAKTHHLMGAREFGLLKPGAYFINTARGGLVDTDALLAALREGRVAGAGLDVTDPEPLPQDHPLLAMDNVIVTSHGICWTDECALGNGHADMEGMKLVVRGDIPRNVANRAVLEKPGFQAKLARLRQRASGG